MDRSRTWLRVGLGVLSALFSGYAAPNIPSGDAIDRVADIRARLLEEDVARSPPASTSNKGALNGLSIAQWYNWPNHWRNWGNWPNWRNF